MFQISNRTSPQNKSITTAEISQAKNVIKWCHKNNSRLSRLLTFSRGVRLGTLGSHYWSKYRPGPAITTSSYMIMLWWLPAITLSLGSAGRAVSGDGGWWEVINHNIVMTVTLDNCNSIPSSPPGRWSPLTRYEEYCIILEDYYQQITG